MVEYIVLMGLVGVVALFGIGLVGTQITTTFEETADVLSDPANARLTPYDPTLPGGAGSPDGSGGSGGSNGGPVITDLDFGYLIDGEFCPERGYSWDWDPWGGFYTVIGTATRRPMFDVWRYGRVTSFDGPPEHTSRVYVPSDDPWNYWGDYIGITLFIWDTWEWTAELPPLIFQGPPSSHEMCDSYTLPDPNEGASPGVYAGYYPDPAGGPFLEGSPGVDTLRMGSEHAGVIAYGRSDVITDTTGSDTIIPGGGDDNMQSDGGADTYVWAPGDGRDTYRPYNTGAGTDIVRIIGLSRADATYSASGRDLTIHLPNSERITLAEQASNNLDYAIDQIEFDDGVMVLPVIYDNRVADLKSTGSIIGTNYPENYFHTASTDGSYSITESDSTRDGDTLTFTETNYDQAIFRQTDRGQDLQIELPDGDRITIVDFITSPNRRIDTIRFADGTVADHDAMIAASQQQSKNEGVVYATAGDDNWTHTASVDGSYDIIGHQGGFDTLTFAETNFADVRFSMADRDLFITLPDGDQIMAEDWNYNRAMIESFVFADGSVYTPQQINDAALDHMKESGVVNASNHDDNHTHTVATDGTYTIQYDQDGTDKLSFTDLSFEDARFAVSYRELIVTTPDGDTITIDDWAYNRRMIDAWEFMGTPYTNQQVADRAAQDAKASGTVEGSDDNDNYVHTASIDGSYTILGDIDGTDTLTFTETSFTDARFAVDGRDLTVTLPDGDVIRLNDQAYYRRTVDQWAFPGGVTPSQQEVFDRAAWDAKASGSVEASDDADNFVHQASTDGSYVIFGDVDGIDSMSFSETGFGAMDFEVSGRDFLMRTPDGDTVTLDDFAVYRSRMENFSFAGTSKTPQEVVDRAHHDGKARGSVEATDDEDNFVHRRSEDGSYTIFGDHDGTDSISFAETSFDAMNFEVSGRDFLMHTPDGDTVTLDDFAVYRSRMENFSFAGASRTPQEIVDRAHEHGQARGSVETTDDADNIVHRRSEDGSYTVHGDIDGPDSIHFAETAFDDVAVARGGYSDWDLIFTLPDGDTVTIVYGARYSSYFETMMFAGQTVSRDDVLAKAN